MYQSLLTMTMDHIFKDDEGMFNRGKSKTFFVHQEETCGGVAGKLLVTPLYTLHTKWSPYTGCPRKSGTVDFQYLAS